MDTHLFLLHWSSSMNHKWSKEEPQPSSFLETAATGARSGWIFFLFFLSRCNFSEKWLFTERGNFYEKVIFSEFSFFSNKQQKTNSTPPKKFQLKMLWKPNLFFSSLSLFFTTHCKTIFEELFKTNCFRFQFWSFHWQTWKRISGKNKRKPPNISVQDCIKEWVLPFLTCPKEGTCLGYICGWVLIRPRFALPCPEQQLWTNKVISDWRIG